MKSRLNGPILALGVVILWRVLLLIFTVQPVPETDSFAYDGAVINYLNGGSYCNPSLAVVFPISGTEVYSTYPPLYQAVLLVWMKLFGTSLLSAMAMHLFFFAVSGCLTVIIIQKFFPALTDYAVALLLLFGITWDDRPESVGFVFGLLSLWLAARQISADRFCFGKAAALSATLLLGLYTSIIVGAYFFGVAFVACLTAMIWRRRFSWLAPFLTAAILFLLTVAAIAKMEPRWWAGFQESARQQSVLTNGAHLPHGADLIKLCRTAPVFLIGLAVLPMIWRRRREVFAVESAGLALVTGILVMGWLLLAAAVTLLAPSYVFFALFTQVLLAAGLLALAQKYFPGRDGRLHLVLWACVLLVSIRAIGMTTWGAACAAKNSYADTRKILQTELKPFEISERPVILSSAYLYVAAGMKVTNAINSSWYFDHSHWTNNAEMAGIIRLQPAKIVVTQFDYYRGLEGPVAQLLQHPETVTIRLRDTSGIRTPDGIPSLQKVVQNISWAPVIIDLDWKTPAP